MAGVTLARAVLDTIDQANRRFVSTLREDQKAALAQHPFDFADYLLFSARWEDARGVPHSATRSRRAGAGCAQPAWPGRPTSIAGSDVSMEGAQRRRRCGLALRHDSRRGTR